MVNFVVQYLHMYIGFGLGLIQRHSYQGALELVQGRTGDNRLRQLVPQSDGRRKEAGLMKDRPAVGDHEAYMVAPGTVGGSSWY